MLAMKHCCDRIAASYSLTTTLVLLSCPMNISPAPDSRREARSLFLSGHVKHESRVKTPFAFRQLLASGKAVRMWQISGTIVGTTLDIASVARTSTIPLRDKD